MAAAALAVADAAHRAGLAKAGVARAQASKQAMALVTQLAPCLQAWQALQVVCVVPTGKGNSMFNRKMHWRQCVAC